MPFGAKVLADSQHPTAQGTGTRLTTMELSYPRIIHSEFLTHRQFSRNAASSRAIPIQKMLKRILDDPFTPLEWGTEISGMVAGVPHADPVACVAWWEESRVSAYQQALKGTYLNLHKQIVNRVVEPFMWITVLATGVDHAWENFFNLRCAPDAEPHIRHVAVMARTAYDDSIPHQLRKAGEAVNRRDAWHLPLIGFPGDEALTITETIKVCVGRCARVSYLTHDGQRDTSADIKLYERLYKGKHASPFEHAAEPNMVWQAPCNKGGNFGEFWLQHRKGLVGEYCTKAPR